MERLDEKLNQYKIPLALTLVGLVLIIGGAFSSGLLNNFSPPATSSKELPQESLVKAVPVTKLKVDISGAVKVPGVYSFSTDSRVEDVIKSAGGFTASASAEYIAKGINLSQKVSDGQKIYIPFEGESLSSLGAIGGQVAGAKTGKIGINTASSSELEDLPGIGPVTAQKIIEARPYQSTDELVSKKAVGKATFEKIKDSVDVN